MRRRQAKQGSAMVEFMLTGIPLLFTWMGIFWMALGMWEFHTLQYAAKMANSYAAVHGANYLAAGGAAAKIKDVANVFAANATGMIPSAVNMTFTAGNQPAHPCRLDNCQNDSFAWPPSAANTTGTDLKLRADFTFLSAFGMWTPTHGATNFSNSYSLSGYSHEQVLF